MKKLILGFFVLGALSFGLQSCGDEDDPCDDCTADQECNDGVCEDIVMECEICGDYDNDATGSINVAGIIDTSFTDDLPLNLPASVTQVGTSTTYTLAVDLSALSDLLGQPIPVDGIYDEATKVLTVTDAEYDYQGLVTIIMNGTADFSTADAVDGNLMLSSSGAIPVTGDIDFAGTKQ